MSEPTVGWWTSYVAGSNERLWKPHCPRKGLGEEIVSKARFVIVIPACGVVEFLGRRWMVAHFPDSPATCGQLVTQLCMRFVHVNKFGIAALDVVDSFADFAPP